jgi:hypothetical protein
MPERIRYDSKGNFEIERDEEEEDYEGSEILAQRADIVKTGKPGQYKAVDELGTMKPPLERKLEADEKKLGWSEPDISYGEEKICSWCGRKFYGRRNQKFCCDSCRVSFTRRKKREERREKEGFKPYVGKNGEVYIRTKWQDGTERKTFIPAIYVANGEYEKWIRERWREREADDIIRQVKEALANSDLGI